MKHSRSHWESLPQVPAVGPTQTHCAHMRKFSFPSSNLRDTCTSHELQVLLDSHILISPTLSYQVTLVRMTQKLTEPFVPTPCTLWSLSNVRSKHKYVIAFYQTYAFKSGKKSRKLSVVQLHTNMKGLVCQIWLFPSHTFF